VRSEISLAETNHPMRILGLTAVARNSSKSCVVSNLATLYSMSGLKTLIIDADIADPAMTKRLLGGSGVADKPHPDPARLNIVHAPGRSYDLLASSVVEAKNLLTPRNMQALLKELDSYDVIIVDLPSLASGAEGLAVGSVLDGVVMVAEWSKTHVDALRELLRTLQANRAPVVGALLTNTRAMTSRHHKA
jgi:Mrp family chromosome partitioning ATPase